MRSSRHRRPALGGLAAPPGTEHVETVVVGSGFGGSVTAYRLASSGRKVCVLERGKAYPPGSFPRRPREVATNFWDPSEGLHGLFDVWSFKGIEALVSAGLGGGSLIYANVLLRKDEGWFVHERPDGSTEPWAVGRADLEDHYAAVERMLGAQRLPFDAPGYDLAKTRALRDAAEARGLAWGLPNLAVTFANPGTPPVPGEVLVEPPYPNLHGRTRLTCRLCGECDVGCNYGSKNTLDHTYLSAARDAGADLRTRCEVRSFTPRPQGGYVVGYVEHRPEAEGRPTDTAALPLRHLTCDRLVLAAGTLGTTWLLLRNRAVLPDLSPTLGSRFSGNGDLLGVLLDSHGGGGGVRVVDSSLGPVITSYVRVPDTLDGGDGPGHYVEDAGYPVALDWMAELTQVPGTLRRLAGFAWRRLWAMVSHHPRSDISAQVGALIGDARLSSRSLLLLGMGRDVPDGTLSLRGGHLANDWTLDSSRPYFERLRATMASLGEGLGARSLDLPTWLRRRLITVHPLGGCPMGRHPGEGVVDGHGRVFGHPGLYVVDGSAMPGPVGPNPALTIAAFADRAAEAMLGEDGAGAAGRSR